MDFNAPIDVPLPASPPPGQVVIDAAALQQLLQAINAKPQVPPPPMPRVGGVNEVGAWTGFGSSDDSSFPRTSSCIRRLKREESKSYTQLNAIEEKIRGGLKSVTGSGPLFCLESEPDAKRVVTVIRTLGDYLETHGLEPVFHIVTATETINMLARPSLLSEDMITTWIQDLKVDGVHDQKGGRLPVCPYDRTNLNWSYDAIMNSCTPDLVEELKSNLTPSQQVGPWLLLKIFQNVYRRAESKVESILTQIESLSLRDFAGENVTLFKQKCDRLLDELAMNLPGDQPVPTLRTKALKGLGAGTFSFFWDQIYLMSLKSTLDPTQSTVKGVKLALRDAHHLYLSLMEQGNYPPGKQPAKEDHKLKAMQAEVKNLKQEVNKLSQDRSASSTTGRPSNGSKTCYPRSDSKPASILKDPKPPADKSVSFDKSAKPSKPAARTPNPPGTNGLTPEQSEQISKLIKEKLATMPDFKDIPDDARYTIEIDGTTMAIFCNKCKRFTRGTKKHHSTEHRGGSSTPARGKSFMAQTPSLGSTFEVSPLSSESVCVPIREPVSYDFAPLERAGLFYTSISDTPTIVDDDDESVASVDHRLLSALGHPKAPRRQD